tara:strand:- start:1262 stop:1936 length:675 start_codon:yes stop_codon:yes gene_type:complete
MIKNISNLGDSALYCDFGNQVNKEINSNVINYFKFFKDKKIYGVTNLTPSYNKLIITFDLTLTNYEKIKEEINKIQPQTFKNNKTKKIKIPICCEGEFALDIINLEKKFQISIEEIYSIFFSKEYFCYMTGFVAAMPFLGDIDSKLQIKRLTSPRVRVPRGSVGITEQFCNIYTFESPGGWNIIGNTPIKIFDKSNILNPALINPGDKVVFYKIDKKEYDGWND